jgi:hypothetical protein
MSHISEEVLTDMLWILEEVMKGEVIRVFNDKVYLCKQGVRYPNVTELHTVLHAAKKYSVYSVHISFAFYTLFQSKIFLESIGAP